MTAEFLVAAKSVAGGRGVFRKKSMSFDNGTRITYQFLNWTEVDWFLERLPERMPSNQVTVPIAAGGHPLTVQSFLYHIDFGGGDYQYSYHPVRGMKKLQDELRDLGIAV